MHSDLTLKVAVDMARHSELVKAQNSTSPIKGSATMGSIDVVKAKHYFCRSKQMGGDKRKKTL